MNKPTDVNSVAPVSTSHIIGQPNVVDQLKIALDAAFEDSRPFDHALLVGPPGMGKSMTANVIAKEMATELHEVLGQSLQNVSDLNALLLQAEEKSIIHIDEAHEMDKRIQTALYLAIDKQHIFINSGKLVQSIEIAKSTILLSSSEEYSLLTPLRDRMRLTLRFSYYSLHDLERLLFHRTKALGWNTEESVFPLIAKRARGTPRWALRLLLSCRRVCRAYGLETINVEHLHHACSLEGIDDCGLGPTDREYLRLLKDGPMRLNVISSAIGLPSKTISEVNEPFLIRAGLITKDNQSRRQLTAKGHEHISQV